MKLFSIAFSRGKYRSFLEFFSIAQEEMDFVRIVERCNKVMNLSVLGFVLQFL